jgi:nicotinamidase-related amidase
MADTLHGPLTDRSIHLCVDMQRIFSPEGLWPTPWMQRVLPVVADIAQRHRDKTVFTRFITPHHPQQAQGAWRRFYERWAEATQSRLPAEMLELMPPLHALVPPAHVVDKLHYSAFAGSALLNHLREREADALVVTGSETDVCVLSTVLDAVDLGFRVIVVRDGICSSSDEGHDASLKIYHQRYSLQIETANAEEILKVWPRDT